MILGMIRKKSAPLPISLVTLAVAAALLSFGCVDDTDDTGGYAPGDGNPAGGDGNSDAVSDDVVEPWAIVVLGTDYLSTSISVVDRVEKELFREGIVDSGSTKPGLSVALSGDVVFPNAPNPKNRIVIIDRYPNSVLTFIDPDDFSVMGQLSVATGFASNPHDFLWIDDHKAYVTRYESNPAPGREPFDGGDDILIVDPTGGGIRGRIALGGYAGRKGDETLQARPGRMAYAGGLVWVTLDHLSADFNASGDGRLVAIDPENDEVVHMLRLPEVTNCTGLAYAAQRELLLVTCSGLFGPGAEGQLARSAIVAVDLGGASPSHEVIRRAEEGGARPFGFDIDILQGRYVLAVRFGDPASGEPDRLVAIDLEDRSERTVHTAATAYGMGGVLADDASDTVYVGDADPEGPAVHLYRLKEGAFKKAGTINTHPESGLPPRHIRFY